jgi:hypothetical protein
LQVKERAAERKRKLLKTPSIVKFLQPHGDKASDTSMRGTKMKGEGAAKMKVLQGARRCSKPPSSVHIDANDSDVSQHDFSRVQLSCKATGSGTLSGARQKASLSTKRKVVSRTELPPHQMIPSEVQTHGASEAVEEVFNSHANLRANAELGGNKLAEQSKQKRLRLHSILNKQPQDHLPPQHAGAFDQSHVGRSPFNLNKDVSAESSCPLRETRPSLLVSPAPSVLWETRGSLLVSPTPSTFSPSLMCSKLRGLMQRGTSNETSVCDGASPTGPVKHGNGQISTVHDVISLLDEESGDESDAAR